MKRELYTIGEISKMCNIPIRTLHYYNDINLVVPEKIDNETNYRYYTDKQIIIINSVKYFKSIGFQLDEIKDLITNDRLDRTNNLLKGKYEELSNKIEKLKLKRKRLNVYFKNIEDNEDIVIKKYPKKSIVSIVRDNTFLEKEVGLFYNELSVLVEENNLEIIDALMLTRCSCRDDKIEIFIPVNKKYKNITKTYGGFLCATIYHYGSYETIHISYEKLINFIEENGFIYTGKFTERYIVDLSLTNNSEEYITEIILQIEKP